MTPPEIEPATFGAWGKTFIDKVKLLLDLSSTLGLTQGKALSSITRQ